MAPRDIFVSTPKSQEGGGSIMTLQSDIAYTERKTDLRLLSHFRRGGWLKAGNIIYALYIVHSLFPKHSNPRIYCYARGENQGQKYHMILEFSRLLDSLLTLFRFQSEYIEGRQMGES